MNWIPQSKNVVKAGRRTFWDGFGRRAQAKKKETGKHEGMCGTTSRDGHEQADCRGLNSVQQKYTSTKKLGMRLYLERRSL